jgi:hypothetical protein
MIEAEFEALMHMMNVCWTWRGLIHTSALAAIAKRQGIFQTTAKKSFTVKSTCTRKINAVRKDLSGFVINNAI